MVRVVRTPDCYDSCFSANAGLPKWMIGVVTNDSRPRSKKKRKQQRRKRKKSLHTLQPPEETEGFVKGTPLL